MESSYVGLNTLLVMPRKKTGIWEFVLEVDPKTGTLYDLAMNLVVLGRRRSEVVHNERSILVNSTFRLVFATPKYYWWSLRLTPGLYRDHQYLSYAVCCVEASRRPHAGVNG